MAHRPITVSRRPLNETETVSVRRPLGLSVKDNLSTIVPTTLTKSHLKIEDKLSKAEVKIQDLERDRIAVHNEMGDLQTELRLAAQREAKLKHNIEKWEKSHSSLKEKTSKLNHLQGRLEELSKLHEDSKARRQKEVDELNEKLKRADERRRHEVAETRKALELERTRAQELESKSKAIEQRIHTLQSTADGSAEELSRTIQKLQGEKESIKVALMDAQIYTKQTETRLQQQIDVLERTLEQRKLALDDQAQKQAQQTESARTQLLAQIQELNNDIDQLENVHECNLAAIAKATHRHIVKIQDDILQKHSVEQEGMHLAAISKMQVDSLANQRLDEIECLADTIKHVEADRDSARQLIWILEQDLDSVLTELQAERALFDNFVEQHTGLEDADLPMLPETRASFEIDHLHSTLEDAQSRNGSLDNEVRELQTRYLEMVGEAKGANIALDAFKKQVTQLEHALATKATEADQLTQQLLEMNVLRSKLRAAEDEMASAVREARSQSETVKSVSASLQNSKVAEQAWREERDHLAIMLSEASKYEELYTELSSQTRHLIERNALAEQEKATLSALNSELLGHTNPNQKIMYMDRIRRELDEVKEDNISLRIQLQHMTTAKLDKEKELRNYKAVDVPLSQRPRTELTRVVRAADHDALLRSVSSTLDKPAESIAAFSAPTVVPLPIERDATEESVTVPASRPLKKRRSYGSISVHAAEAPLDSEPISDDETEQDETLEAIPRPAVANRNRPRATLVNSGSLRHTSSAGQDQPSNLPLTMVTEQSYVAEELEDNVTQTAPLASASVVSKNAARPSLGVSALGIKARRVSELVRASSPTLPMIPDVSSDVPNLMNAALPSPSPHMMSDWTMDTPGSAPMPLLRGEFGVGPASYGVAHSTPLARLSPRKAVINAGEEDARPRTMRRSRYSGAQRVAVPQGGLRPSNARASLMIREESGEESTIYEDQDDSLRQGWHDDGIGAQHLPEFTIDGMASNTITQKQQQKALPRKSKSSKARPSASKLVKPGPMARSIFR